MGTAPTRAYARGRGLSECLTLELLTRAVRSGFAAAPEESRWLNRLLALQTPNVWMLSGPDSLEMRSAWLSRLAALAYFTQGYVRQFPRRFVDFVYSRQLAALDDQAVFLDKESIEQAVHDSYTFSGFYSPHPGDWFYAEAPGVQFAAKGVRDLRVALEQLRYQCQELAESKRAAAKSRAGTELWERAWRNYEILNFVDARDQFLAIGQ